MQGMMWKLSATAAAIGVGSIVYLQVQRGMELTQQTANPDVQLESYALQPETAESSPVNAQIPPQASPTVAGQPTPTGHQAQAQHEPAQQDPWGAMTTSFANNAPKSDLKPTPVDANHDQPQVIQQSANPWGSPSQAAMIPTTVHNTPEAVSPVGHRKDNEHQANNLFGGFPQETQTAKNSTHNPAPSAHEAQNAFAMQSHPTESPNAEAPNTAVGLFAEVPAPDASGMKAHAEPNHFALDKSTEHTHMELTPVADASHAETPHAEANHAEAKHGGFPEMAPAAEHGLKPVPHMESDHGHPAELQPVPQHEPAQHEATAQTAMVQNLFPFDASAEKPVEHQENKGHQAPAGAPHKQPGEIQHPHHMATGHEDKVQPSSGLDDQKPAPMASPFFEETPAPKSIPDGMQPIKQATPPIKSMNEIEHAPAMQPLNLTPVEEPAPLTQPLMNPQTTPPAKTPEMDLTGDAVVQEGVPRGVLKPELKIEKIAPSKSMLGEAMVYTIVVRNTGTLPAQNVMIEDLIPKGTTLTGTIPRAQLKDKKLIWKFNQIEPGQEETVKVRVVPTEEGDIGSVTTVSFRAEIAAETRITAPKLEITLTDLEQTVVGENMMLNFTVRNIGEGDAAGVILHSVLPNQLNHTAGRDLEYEIGTLNAGASKDVRLSVQAVEAGIANLHARVTAKGDKVADTKADLEVIPSILSLTRKGPSRRFVGREATYTMQLENLSIRDANQIVIQEVVPAGLAFVSANGGGAYNPNNRLVTWNIPRLAGKASLPLEVKLTAEKPGDHESSIEVTDREGHQASLKAVTRVEGFAQLGIREVNGKGPISIKEKASYSFHVANRGSATATNVRFVCIMPEKMKFVSANGSVRYTQNENKLIFDPIPTLPPGKEEQFEVVLAPETPGEVMLQIAVSSEEMQTPVTHTEAVIIYQESN
jgi:uncharacterized repeat protein (TIGR01451 family)